jgi:hypothetical protein
MYIFGHELTHALAGFLSGARINAFKVKKNSGSVSLSKVNIFSVLAPYFVPIYSMILIIAYALANLYAKQKGCNIHPYFLFLLGFTLAFHVALTVFAIRQGQSDLREYGVVFSSFVIIIANCVVLALIFSLFSSLLSQVTD